MSVFDWVEMGFADNDAEEKLGPWKGAFSCTIGDSLSAKVGADHAHVFGPSIKLVCDPEDMLVGSTLEKAMPLLAGLLCGVGQHHVHVRQQLQRYVRRSGLEHSAGSQQDKASNNIIARKQLLPPTGGGETDVIDETACKLVALLSIALCLTSLILDLTIHFTYPMYGSSKDDEETKETIEGYGKTPGLLKICSYTISARLMALIKLVEEHAGEGNHVEMDAADVKYTAALVTRAGAASVPVPEIVAALVAEGKDELEQGLEAAKEAL